jgi:hypothetical protein
LTHSANPNWDITKPLTPGNGQLGVYDDATKSFIAQIDTAQKKNAALLDLSKKAADVRSKTPPKDLLSGLNARRRDEPTLAERQKAIDQNIEQLGRVAVQANDTARDEQLKQGRLSRSALTLEFEQREEAIEKQREALTKLQPVISNTQRFMSGLRGETDALGNSFERFGDSVGNAFGDVRNLFSNLKSAIKSFFADITGNVLRNVTASVLGPLIGKSPSFAGAGGGGGVGSVLTGGFAGGNPAADIFRGVAGGGYGGAVPGSRPSSGGIFGGLQNFFSGGAGAVLGAGIAGGSIGALLGGQSIGGNILGAIGGGVTGIATGALLSGGLQIGSLALSGLAAMGVGAAIAAPLIIGSILLGKAKQRKADEKVVDTYWVEYSRVLRELTGGVNADRITGDDALVQAAEARQTAVDLIGQIKTKSVRESRLRNQIPQIDAVDLRNLQNAVSEQRARLADQSAAVDRRRDLDSRLVPEFATGGVVPGPFGAKVPAYLHAGEVVLNQQQIQQIGADTLADAGVPGVKGGNGGGGYVIENNITLIAGTETQDQFFVNGVTSRNTRGALASSMSRVLRYGG